MDPVFRLLWWMKNQSSVMAMARYFLGWHEFLTLRLTGRAVTDRSLAGKWLVYDLKGQHWSPDRISQFRINPDLLPEIEPWGAIIGSLDKEVSLELGLPSDIKVGVGGFDASCSALGAGASKGGTACLLSGTWEDLIVPITAPPPTSELVKRCFSVGPYPGEAGLAIFGLSPNGTSAFDWGRNLVGMALKDVDANLKSQAPGPSPVLAIPHLSGAAVPWTGGSKSRGALLGLTLATTSIDIFKSILESIVYDLYYTVNLLKENSVKLGVMRGAGGGIRSEWWTQLKADLTMTSVEAVNQPEPGTVGAALLAGLAIGAFDNLESKLSEFTKVSRQFTPDSNRAGLYKQRIRSYKELVSDLLHAD
jgi:xylulokinase